MEIESFDRRGRKHALERLVLLAQGTSLLVVPDGVFGGKDGHRLHPSLHTVAIGLLGLPRSPGMVRQFGGPRSFGVQQLKSALVQDLPSRLAQFGVDYVTDQLIPKPIPPPPPTPAFLLPH